ncbi:hypothetical protein B0H11DRAFT_2221492 [Mycena galericulata]|nr:hypothetical protein B0H11DRAFT_2221492 [Mycena galericulata]
MSVQQPMNWIPDLHDKIVNDFLETWHTITVPGLVAREIRIYLDGLANLYRANDTWSFESERYFGKQGAEIMRT